jgi:hypothetical protein
MNTHNKSRKDKKEKLLEVNWVSAGGAVLNAIKEAHIRNLNVIKLGLPIKVQREIMKDTPIPKGKELKTLFGVKVERSKTMQITTEFYRFLRK